MFISFLLGRLAGVAKRHCTATFFTNLLIMFSRFGTIIFTGRLSISSLLLYSFPELLELVDVDVHVSQIVVISNLPCINLMVPI